MLKKAHILIVDDDKEMTEEVSEILGCEGYFVTVANDGIRGDSLLSKDGFDLVLLDMKLPGMDGLTILKRIRERGTDIRVIILTARPFGSDLLDGIDKISEEDAARLRQVDGIMTKPYNIVQLLELIKKTVSIPEEKGL